MRSEHRDLAFRADQRRRLDLLVTEVPETASVEAVLTTDAGDVTIVDAEVKSFLPLFQQQQTPPAK